MIWHGWDEFVEHATPPEQRVSANLQRLELKQSIHAEAFASCAEHCRRHHCESVDQGQSVAPGWFADTCGAKPHAKPQILGTADIRLDGPTFGVTVDLHGGGSLGVAEGKTPRLLHRFAQADGRTDLNACMR